MFLKGGVSIGAEMDSLAADLCACRCRSEGQRRVLQMHVPIFVLDVLTPLVNPFWSHLPPTPNHALGVRL